MRHSPGQSFHLVGGLKRVPSLIEKCIPKVSNGNLVGTQKIKQYDARRGLFKINTRLGVVPDRMFAIHPVIV